MTVALPIAPPPTATSRLRGAPRSFALGVVGIGVALALWQWATTTGPWSDVRGLPTSAGALHGFVDLSTRASTWEAAGRTLALAATAALLAAVVGTLIGVAVGYSAVLQALVMPTVAFMRCLPTVALIPLALLILGPTAQLAVVLAVLASVWPVLDQALVGIRSVDAVSLEAARAMNLSWLATQRLVVLPSALTSIATGVRIAVVMCVLLVVGSGILAGSPGLGQTVVVLQQTGDVALVFGAVLWCAVIGLLMSTGFAALEGRLTRNHRRPEVSG